MNYKLMLFTALTLSACSNSNSENSPNPSSDDNPHPDALPVMTNRDLPFRYPPALYAQKVQGNVTLRIHIDSNGKVNPDSTRVAETSGQSALDSAAVRGSRELTFVPAKRRGEPLAVSILFPVYFRHPEAPAMPGDTVLAKQATTTQ